MVTAKKTDRLVAQARLWVGSIDKLIERTYKELQRQWCPTGGCTRCILCTNIMQRQHHCLVWVAPKNIYTREDLAPIFQRIQYAQDPGQYVAFVIERADCLTPACYNSLLKSLEEPPAGFYFLLLAERLQEVAETIRSRCIIEIFDAESADISFHRLGRFFVSAKYDAQAVHDFSAALEQQVPHEQETILLLDGLYAYWSNKRKKLISSGSKADADDAERVLTLLGQALQEYPAPGSSKLIWRTLFMHLKQ